MTDENMIDISDKDASIYRIFSKQRFLEILTSGTNDLVSPSKWDDPFENFFLNSKVKGENGENISMANIAAGWYGQCWTYNVDTDAMWRIYSSDKKGVKVKTTVRKLFNSLYDAGDGFATLKFFVGKVSYLTESEIKNFMSQITFWQIARGGQGDKFAKLLCIKREAFHHENEVRLLYQDVESQMIVNSGAASFKFEVNSILDEIVLDPRLDSTEVKLMETELKNAGCTVPIAQSTLYRVPKFEIRL